MLSLKIPLKILIAEDDAINQKVAQKILKALGYSADIVNNGKEVLQRIEQEAYDLLLVDIQMPELDGIETTKIIVEKQTIYKKPTVIIARSANELSTDKDRCILADMQDFINKPLLKMKWLL